MNKDFYFATLTGLVILLIFWVFVLIFIYVRKPPRSKLNGRIIIYSFFIFLIFFISIIIIRYYDSFIKH